MALINTITNIGNGYGSAASAIGNLGRAAGSYANKIKSLTNKYDSPLNIRDIYTNGFLPGIINAETKTVSSIFTPKFFARAYDEPTYLTFRIEFIFNDDLRNTVYNNNNIFYKSIQGIQPPYDFMPEPFLEDSKEINPNEGRSDEKVKYFDNIEQTETASDGSTGYIKNQIGSSRYSTEHYLRTSLGEYRRANMLETFKQALKDIQYVYPFYFTSISGLQNLSNVDTKRGIRLKDAVITIDCLEALDQRITYLLNLYRKIVWDDVYQRWVIPDMMRYFGMKIYVSEIRLFHTWMPNSKDKQENRYTDVSTSLNNVTYPSKTGGVEKTIGDIRNIVTQGTAITNSFLGTQSNITKAVNIISSAANAAGEVYAGIKDIMNDLLAVDNAINHVMPTICYECHMCEFDISETMSHIDSLDSWNSRKSISPKLKIKVGQVREYQDYPLNKYLKMDSSGAYNFDGTGNDKNGSLKDVGTKLDDDLLAKRRPEYNEKKIAEETQRKKSSSPSNPDGRFNYITNISVEDTSSGKISPQKYKGIEEMKYSPELVTTKTSKTALTTSLLNETLDAARKYIKADGVLDQIGRDSVATYPDKSAKSDLISSQSKIQYEEYKNLNKNATGLLYENTEGNQPRVKVAERKDIDLKIQELNSINATESANNTDKQKVLFQRDGDESIDRLTKPENETLKNFHIVNSNTTVEKEIENFYINENDDLSATKINEENITRKREEFRKSIKDFENQVFEETFGEDSASFPNVHNINKIHALKDMLDAALEKIYKGGEIESMAVSDQMKAKIAEDMFDEFLKDLELSKATNNQTLKNFLSAYRTLQEEDKYGNSPATNRKNSGEFRRNYSSSFNKLN